MDTMLFVGSHTPTAKQIQTAPGKLDQLHYVAPELQKKLSQIPPEANSIHILMLVKELKEVIVDGQYDYLALSGEPSFVAMAYSELRQDVNIVFATTKRVSKEEEIDGKIVKTNVFEHVQWRAM
jgi:hypothetical protein